MNTAINKIKSFISDKDTLTLWLNNLFVLYAFFLPISGSIKAKVFIVILLLFIIRGNIKRYIKEALSNNVIRAFVYLFVIYLLGLLWSDDLKEGLRWVKSIKYGLYLIVFYSFIDGRYIKKVLTAFILGMLLSEIISYCMLFGILPWELIIGHIHFYATQAPGDASPFLNHIHYGVALSLVVVLLIYQIYFRNKNLIFKLLMSLFIISASTNIFVTGGRTGYLSFLVLLSALAIFYLKRWAIIGLIVISFLLSIAYMNSPMMQSRVNQTIHSVDNIIQNHPDFNTSIGIRAGLYYYGWQAVKHDLVLGLGTGDSMHAIYNQSPPTWKGRLEPHEHNQFFSILMKLGIVGVLFFLNIYYQIFKYKQDDKELRFIMLFTTLAVTIGVLTTQFNLRFFMPLWVVMLTITLISKDRKTIIQNIDDKKNLFRIIVLGLIFSIFNLYSKSL